MQEQNKMGIMPIPKLLASMALPLVVSMLIQALYNIVDSIFVSHISENALTAVSLAFPAQNMMIAFAVGTGVGINACLSRNLGEGNRKQADKTASHAIFLWILNSSFFALIGLLFSHSFFSMQTDDPEIIELGSQYFFIILVFCFGLFGSFTFERLLQATGRSMETMITQASGALINIILDPILIFGFDMGVRGAALATVIGQISACFIGMWINHRKNHEISISMKGFRPERHTMELILRISIPAIIMQSLTSIMSFFMNLILIGFSSTATAVFGIYYKVQSFFFMPLYGTTNALVPIVAYNYGARKKDRMEHVIRLSMKVASVLMITGTVVFLLIPDVLLALFNANETMLAIGVPALRLIGLNFPFAGISIICSSVFQAVGRGGYSLINSLIRQIFILLPVAFLFSLTGTLELVWLAFPIAELAGFILALVLKKGLFKKLEI